MIRYKLDINFWTNLPSKVWIALANCVGVDGTNDTVIVETKLEWLLKERPSDEAIKF